ncbi:substrate-binding periplasmic protein [Pseudomonas sp. PhalM4]
MSAVFYPPFNEIKEGGEYVGLEAEVLKYFAKRECLKLVAENSTFAASPQFVSTNRADVSAGEWYRTEAREKTLGLSTAVFAEYMAVFSKEGYTKISDADGKYVGTVQGYLWVNDLKKIYGSKLKLYPTLAQALQDLQNNRISAVFDAYTAGTYAQKQGALTDLKLKIAEPDPRVEASTFPTQTGFLYNKGNTSLGVALNAAIKEMHENGEILRILNSHNLPTELAKIGEPRLIKSQ